MNFYKKIAEHYDQIFAPNHLAVDFFSSLVDEGRPVLDVGCATGEITYSLAQKGYNVTGIDLDETMISQALHKDSAGAQFKVLNMLDISKSFDTKSFNLIICIGNTIVHLPSLDEITNFLEQVRDLLFDNGLFALQVVNYDRVFAKNIKELPIIENEDIRFSRYYNLVSKDEVIFKSILEIKKEGQQIEGEVTLRPLYKEQIEKLLLNAGFCKTNFYGDYKLNKWSIESAASIAIAEKC